MSLPTLITKIQQDAASSVEEIQAENARKIAAIQRETDEALKVLEEKYEHALQKQLDHLELVAVSKAKQEANLSLQATKRTLIDSVFAAVKAELVAMTAEEYVRFFGSYAARVVPTGLAGATVTTPANRTAETEKIMTELACVGEVSTDATSDAGLIIATADGVYDITLDRLFEERRADLEMQVASKLAS